VNEDPYERGWILRFRPDEPAQFETLLDASAYERHTLEHH
jgi:glycine cleavage system H protein